MKNNKERKIIFNGDVFRLECDGKNHYYFNKKDATEHRECKCDCAKKSQDDGYQKLFNILAGGRGKNGKRL